MGWRRACRVTRYALRRNGGRYASSRNGWEVPIGGSLVGLVVVLPHVVGGLFAAPHSFGELVLRGGLTGVVERGPARLDGCAGGHAEPVERVGELAGPVVERFAVNLELVA